MATVEMTFTPLPAHVRTARLVATAVARRSGVAEALLDEVRLAVGEACSRAVEVHREQCPDEPVRVALTGGGGRFEVVVTNAAHVDSAWGAGESFPPQATFGAVAGTGPGVSAAAQGGLAHNGPPAGTGVTDTPGDTDASGDPLAPAELGLAVIAGLADDVSVSRSGNGLSIRMSWPSTASIKS